MDEQVKQLAETLKKNGLAASEYEAIEKAKSILNVNSQKSDSQEGAETQQTENQPPISPETEQPMPNLDINIKNENATLNELMKEINVSPEEVESQEKQRIDDIKADISEVKQEIEHAENNPEQIQEIREEVKDIKEEVNKLTEDQTEEIQNPNNPEEPQENKPEQNDMFEEEKKIDLTKVFNKNKQ
jgi:hypothetical protein